MGVLKLEKHYRQGLRPEGLELNSEFMAELKNARCIERGLRPPLRPVYDAVISSPAYSQSFPHPQVRPGAQGVVFLLGATDIYTLDLSGALPAAATAVTVYSSTLGADVVSNGDFSSSTGWSGTNWTIAGGLATHTTGSTASLAKSCLTSGHFYEISFRVKNRTAGTVTPIAGTTAGSAVSANKIHRQWLLTAGSSVLSFAPTTDFDGAVDDVYVKRVSAGTITTGGTWHMAAFRNSVYWATNGASTVFNMPANPQDGSGNSLACVENIADGFTCQTVLAHMGKLLIGGPTLTNLESTRLAKVLDAWRRGDYGPDDPRSMLVMSEVQVFGTQWVFVSEPGLGASDDPGALLMAMLQVPGTDRFDHFEQKIISAVEDGTIQALPLRQSGSLMQLLSFGDDIIALSARSVSLLASVNGVRGYVERPMLFDGTPGRGCGCAGVYEGQPEAIFVTKQNQVYIVGAQAASRYPWAKHIDGPLYRLGYTEWMAELTLTSVVISFDSVECEYFITDGAKCFNLTRTGLFRCVAYRPTSLIRIGEYNGLIGPAITATGSGVTVEATTERFDGGVKGLKDFLFAKLATRETEPDEWTGVAGWRVDGSDALAYGTEKDVDGRGYCRVKQLGLEHNLKLLAVDMDKVNLEYVECNVVASQEGSKPALRSVIA